MKKGQCLLLVRLTGGEHHDGGGYINGNKAKKAVP